MQALRMGSVLQARQHLLVSSVEWAHSRWRMGTSKSSARSQLQQLTVQQAYLALPAARSRGQLAHKLIHISLDGCQLALRRQAQPIGRAQRDERARVKGRGVRVGVAKHLQVLQLARRGVSC